LVGVLHTFQSGGVTLCSKEALMLIEDILGKIEAQAEALLSAADVSMHPLVLQLAGRYQLTASESDLFQLLFVRGASKSPSVKAFLCGFHSPSFQQHCSSCAVP
jgi:hypothetical protein